jgi:hypothetical protein
MRGTRRIAEQEFYHIMTLQSRLNLPDETPIMLTKMQVGAWGRTLIFEGTAGDLRFTLMLDDVREIRWRVYAHSDTTDVTPIVDFVEGRDQHRSPFQMLTEHFGLTVYYGNMALKRADSE